MVVSALSTAATAAAEASEPSAQELLDRYRPLLRYDDAERFVAQPARDPRNPRRSEEERVYGHVAKEDGAIWLQYWLFFAQNTQDRGIFQTGRHQGDWELVQVGLDADRTPKSVTFSQHSSAEACGYDEVEREGDVPVVYVANGSHALYPYPGVADRPFPDPNDEARGDGESSRPRVDDDDDPTPAWSTYEGRWGADRAGIFPGEASSPVGPPFQESDAWDRPASYHEAARPCGSGPPGRWWTLPALAVFLIAMAGAAALVVRRVRR